MAIDCLSALPMSAPSETTFSGCRRTITWTRSQLGGQVVEEGECMKDWQRRGYSERQDSDDNDDDDDDDEVFTSQSPEACVHSPAAVKTPTSTATAPSTPCPAT